jgi:hypothetical protein
MRKKRNTQRRYDTNRLAVAVVQRANTNETADILNRDDPSNRRAESVSAEFVRDRIRAARAKE